MGKMSYDMGLEEEWLSQILGASTKIHYKKGMGYFLEFLGMSKAEELRGLPKAETKVLQFFQWLQKEKGLNKNSARARVVSVQSFFAYIKEPLNLKNKLPAIGIKVENWRPSLDDIQKVFRLGDISAKAWLSLSRDCPARMSDLLKITPEQIETGEFVLISQKENVVGKCYISEETKALFRQLKEANIQLPTSQRGIDKMIANACRVAGFQKRLNQHLFRKIWISQAINLGLSEPIVKILSFKSVDKSLLTYMLDRNDLKDSWKKVIDSMPLEHTNGNGRVNNIEEALDLVMSALRKLIEKETHQFESAKMTGPDLRTDKEVIEEYVNERRRVEVRA
jgi:integrase